jgi:hypothetical protein
MNIRDVKLNFFSPASDQAVQAFDIGDAKGGVFPKKEKQGESFRLAGLSPEQRMLFALTNEGVSLPAAMGDHARSLRAKPDRTESVQCINTIFEAGVAAIIGADHTYVTPHSLPKRKDKAHASTFSSEELHSRMAQFLLYSAHQHTVWGVELPKAPLQAALVYLFIQRHDEDPLVKKLGGLVGQLTHSAEFRNFDTKNIERIRADIRTNRRIVELLTEPERYLKGADAMIELVSDITGMVARRYKFPMPKIEARSLREGSLLCVSGDDYAICLDTEQIEEAERTAGQIILSAVHESRHIFQLVMRCYASLAYGHTLQNGPEPTSLDSQRNRSSHIWLHDAEIFLLGDLTYRSPVGDDDVQVITRDYISAKTREDIRTANVNAYISCATEQDARKFAQAVLDGFSVLGLNSHDKVLTDSELMYLEDLWAEEEAAIKERKKKNRACTARKYLTV